MTRELAKNPTDRALARFDGEENPFSLIPVEWVPAVSYFAMCKANILKSPVALCAQVKIWVRDGLTLADAQRIFGSLCRPEMAQHHVFDNKLIADLNAMVAQALRRARIIREQELRREAAEQPAGAAAEIVRLADSFPTPPRGPEYDR